MTVLRRLLAWFRARPARLAWILIVVHFGIAVVYKEVVGLNIQAGPSSNLGYLWQVLPFDLLRHDLFGSLWYFHAQPPLYNLYIAFFVHLFYDVHPQAIHYGNIVLGSLVSGMAYIIALGLTRRVAPGGLSRCRPALAFGVALVFVALNPGLFLYEAYLLYTVLETFLITAAVYCLTLYGENPRPRYLYAFIFALNLLVLARALYHVAILLPAILLVVVLARSNWRRVLAASLLISLLGVGWYAKNYVQFGFFGASSWTGQNLWRIARLYFDEPTLISLANRGEIDRAAAELQEFSAPSEYTRYGFVATSEIEVLQRDTLNNINVPAISSAYLRSALRLIEHNPAFYLDKVYTMSYREFTCPAARYHHIRANAERIPLHEGIYAQVIYGQWLADAFWARYGYNPVCSVLFFELPATLLIYAVAFVAVARLSPRRWVARLRADPAMAYAVVLIVYTLLAGTMVEHPENNRFRFPVEPIFWLFAFHVAYNLLYEPARRAVRALARRRDAPQVEAGAGA